MEEDIIIIKNINTQINRWTDKQIARQDRQIDW